LADRRIDRLNSHESPPWIGRVCGAR